LPSTFGVDRLATTGDGDTLDERVLVALADDGNAAGRRRSLSLSDPADFSGELLLTCAYAPSCKERREGFEALFDVLSLRTGVSDSEREILARKTLPDEADFGNA